MTLPTWNGKPVTQGSPEMSDAITQSWLVLQETLGGTGLTQRSAEELLHAVEAAAWLERMAGINRHLLVPAAKSNGASWDALGAAMGVTNGTARQRHHQDVEEWEGHLRQAASQIS